MIDPAWVPAGLGLPIAIGAVSAFAFIRRSGPDNKALAAIGWTLGIALGCAAGMLALFGFPPWKPVLAQHWILIGVLPAVLLVGLLNAVPKLPWIVHWLVRLGVVSATAYILMQSQIGRWSSAERFGWLGAIAGVMLLSWVLLHLFARRTMGQPKIEGMPGTRLLVFALGLTAGVVGAATIASGSVTGGQLTASFAVAVCGAWLATLSIKNHPISPSGLVDGVFPVGYALLVYSWYYAWQMEHDWAPHVVAGLFAIAPIGVWITAAPGVKSLPRGPKTLLGVVGVGLPLAIGMGLAAYEAMLRSQASGPSYY